MEEVKEEVKVEKKEKKSKKWLIIIIILLLLLGGFLYWWFNRKFEISFKYNNSAFEDTIVNVKYLRLIDEKDVKEDIKVDGKTFIGWFETYYLNGEQIESIKKDSKKEVSICKEGFKLDSTKVKCVSEKEFDFKNTKIKKDTIIEALWSSISFSINPTSKTINEGENFKITVSISGTKDKAVVFSSSDNKIATVDSNGKVVGVKKGTTTINAESNGIVKKCTVTVKEIVKEDPKKEEPKVEEPKKEEPVVVKDEGTIKLSANDQCIIGTSDTITLTAKVSDNALDKTVNWTLPKCYTSEKVSDTTVKLTRTGRGTMCRSEEEREFTVTVKLNNGSTDSIKLTYEPTLEINVYENGREIQANSEGKYKGNKITIKTNESAIFTGKAEFDGSNIVTSSTENNATIKSYARGTVTIKTKCGQTKTIKVEEEIN